MNWSRGLLILLTFAVPAGVFAHASYEKFAVATVHPLASQAAKTLYNEGGNAVDAAIVAALTLGVVDTHNSGIGGGCFIMIRNANGEVMCLDGRETAPAKAHRDLYVIEGKLEPEASQTGALASGVPGALMAYAEAVKHHGKLPFSRHLNLAAEFAEQGFALDRVFAQCLKAEAKNLALFEDSKRLFLKDNGEPYVEGDVLVQKDLAKTYRAIAEHGIDWFYRGEFAQRTEAWMKANGGILEAQDFANYQVLQREPVRTTYRDYELLSVPPPSSGGVHLAQILNILEHFPVKHLRTSSRVHLVTEAFKLAFADRAYWLGDPDFQDVPKGLIEKTYAKQLAAKIDLDRVTEVALHSTPENWKGDIFGKHTTHLSTADADGNWVALTQTINTAFGSKVVIPGTGVMMNNEMDDFAIQPGVPNAFGLVGMEANAVAANKRPLSSMSPSLLLHDGQPILSVGAAGGPTIITQTLLAILHVIEDEMSLNQALAQPRFHHQWKPSTLKIEQDFGPEVLTQLKALGHELDVSERFGATQGVLQQNEGQTLRLEPAHDPRIPGKVEGF